MVNLGLLLWQEKYLILFTPIIDVIVKFCDLLVSSLLGIGYK